MNFSDFFRADRSEPCAAPVAAAGVLHPPLTLAAAVSQVLECLPAGTTLADYVYIEHYPLAPDEPSTTLRRPFAYHFMTTTGRNIATWIPDPDKPVVMQKAPGRPYVCHDMPRQSIAECIVDAAAAMPAAAPLPVRLGHA